MCLGIRSVTSRSASRPAACIAARLQDVEQTSLVPAWVKVLCPNATELDLGWDTLAPRPLHQPRPHLHLHELRWEHSWAPAGGSPVAAHVREQLAALPSLTSLTVHDLSWAGEEEEGEQQAGRLISSTVTRLELRIGGPVAGRREMLQRLPTQFPHLRQLGARIVTVEDDGLEALLRLPHLERLAVWNFSMQRSHAHRACLWAELEVAELDVGSFARLPLDTIPVCRCWGEVRPSTDAAAVVRVAQAVRRWCGMGRAGGNEWFISGKDAAALVTTLGPLLAALPTEQQRRVTISFWRDVTPQQVQQLGQHLPPSTATLHLNNYTLSPDAWAALLPSLPATVEELELGDVYPAPTEQQVLALCRAAVQPIRVVVSLSRWGAGLSERDLVRIRALLVGPEQQPSLVTLVGHLKS